MTLDSIDQALNVLLAGLIYGSGVWLACAFSFYVVSRQRQRKASRSLLLLAPAAELPVAKTFEESDLLAKEPLSVERYAENEAPRIEIFIEQPSLIAPSAEVAESVVKTVELPVRSPVQPLLKRETDSSISQTLCSSIEIVCEPVDWKKWKVADLRKASIAKVCGVRTRPIGSRRNLPKADLIAQYQQQLTRMTKASMKRSVVTEVVA